MNSPDQAWSRLVAGARGAVDPRGTAAPYGFATRVAALATSTERTSVSLLERLSWRAVAVACLLALVSTAVSYSIGTTPAEEDALSDDGTVSTLLDIS